MVDSQLEGHHNHYLGTGHMRVLMGGEVSVGGGLSFGSFGHVSFHVQGKVVTPRKRSLAHRAPERFGTRVLSVVSCQLV